MEFNPLDPFAKFDKQPEGEDTVPYEVPDASKLSDEIFEHYRSHATNWLKQVEEDRDFVRMAQTDEAKRLRMIKTLGLNTPILEVDVISPAVEQAVGNLTSHSPSYTATATEDSDVRVAQMIADLYRWIWNRNMMKAKCKLLLRDYYVASKGWVLAWWDEDMEGGMGNVHYSLLDPLNVFVDPESSDLFHSDSPHIIVASITTKERALAEIPMADDLVKKAKTTSETLRVQSGRSSSVFSGSAYQHADTRSDKYLVLDRYSRVRVDGIAYLDPVSGYECEHLTEKDNEYLSGVCFLQSAENQPPVWYFEKSSLKDLEADYQATGGVFHFAVNRQTGQTERMVGAVRDTETHEGIPGSMVTLLRLPRSEAVKAGALRRTERKLPRIQRVYTFGGVVIEDVTLPLSHYPVVPLINNFDRTPYVISDVRRVKGLQEYINDLTSLVVAHAAASTNFKVGYPRGAYSETELNALWNKPGVTFIPFDSDLGSLVPLTPAPLPNELYRNIEEAKYNVERILGVYAMGQGDSRGAPDTYKGTLTLDEFSQRRMGSKREDFDSFLIQLGTVTYELLQAYMQDFRVVRITRPNGKGAKIYLNADKATGGIPDESARIDDLATMRCDVTVVAGSTLPTNRWAQAEYYMMMYEKGIIDRQEVLLKSDVVDREGVMERMNQLQQMNSALEQAQEQIKRLQGDLQTAQRESISDRKRVEVMQFEKELAKTSANVKAAMEAFKNEMRLEMRDQQRQRAQKRKGQ